MTRRKSPEPPVKIREGPSLGNGEPTVVRPDEEPSWADELWNQQNDPHRPENHKWGKRFHGQLMGNLGDDAFMISMRNRRREIERELAVPEIWRWIKRVLFRAPEVTSVSGFEIKRLIHLAGRTPPESLPDFTDVDTSYDDFMRLVSAAEAHMSQAAMPPGEAHGAG